MRVLIACEFSGVVRDAFLERGHDALSCDILPGERPGPHIQADVRTLDLSRFDLMIAHPPCTYLCNSGARWWKNRKNEQDEAIAFVCWLLAANIEKIAVENPVGILSTVIRKPDQIIQPWQFGHGEVKTTCLWLKNLPLLVPSQIVDGRVQRCWRMSASENRSKERSRTYEGIARAMAEQWG